MAATVVGVAAATLLVAAPADAKPGVGNLRPSSTAKLGTLCVQLALNYVSGVGLVRDGVYGQATYTAVQNFQRFFGLSVDGVVGPQTGSLLFYLWDTNSTSHGATYPKSTSYQPFLNGNYGYILYTPNRNQSCWAYVPTNS